MTDKTIAVEILRQLGGNRFIAMTGARNFTCDNNSMGFMIPGTLTNDRINFVKITLNAMDTYDIEFKSIRNMVIRDIDSVEGVYNDMLVNVFESRTGLKTSLLTV